MMRVLVVGGGHLGHRVFDALAARGIAADVSSSRPDAARVRVDMSDPSTFSAFSNYDVIIDCSDAIRHSPLRAAQRCLEEGRVFIETSAHPGTAEELLQLQRASLPPAGLVIVGMGIFPGISNLLARRLIAETGQASRVELAVRVNALSSGGRGMVHQMIDSLFEQAVRYEKGERVVCRPVAAGIEFPFPGGPSATLEIGLPEAILFHESLGAANTGTYLSLRPSVFMAGVRVISFAGTRFGAAIGKLVARTMRLLLIGLRVFALRGRPTPVDLGIIADRHGRRRPDGRVIVATCPDGVGSAAKALAEACVFLGRVDEKPKGVLTADEVFGASFWDQLGDVVTITRSPPV